MTMLLDGHGKEMPGLGELYRVKEKKRRDPWLSNFPRREQDKWLSRGNEVWASPGGCHEIAQGELVMVVSIGWKDVGDMQYGAEKQWRIEVLHGERVFKTTAWNRKTWDAKWERVNDD